jgi:hypothetical protein
MTGRTVVLSDDSWQELKARVLALEALWDVSDGRQASEWTGDELMDKATSAGWMGYDLRVMFGMVDEDNARRDWAEIVGIAI